MKFTKRSAQWRRHLQRKKKLVEILGGKVAATHSSAEVRMKHAPPLEPAAPAPKQVPDTPLAYQRRVAYFRRRAEQKREVRP